TATRSLLESAALDGVSYAKALMGANRRAPRWFGALLGSIAGFGLSHSALAFTLSESATAPSTNLLTSQLGDATGAQINNENYTDNSGPPGQSFTLASGSSYQVQAITILGRGDSGSADNTNWSLQIGGLDL